MTNNKLNASQQRVLIALVLNHGLSTEQALTRLKTMDLKATIPNEQLPSEVRK